MDPRQPISPENPSRSSVAARADERLVPNLTLRNGEKLYQLSKDRVVIGSVVSADVRLSADGVAPIHAVLELELKEGTTLATVYDLASETGIFVNGNKVVTHSLKEGDRLTVGPFELGVSYQSLSAESLKPEFVLKGPAGERLRVDPKTDLAALILEDPQRVREIFEERSGSASQSLEVILAWHGTILDVQYFSGGKRVTWGATRQADFGIPPVLTQADGVLAEVSTSGANYSINIDPKWEGALLAEGSVKTLGQLRETAPQSPQGLILSLKPKEFIKLTVGSLDFYISYSNSPPRMKRNDWMERDPLLFKIIGTSLLLTALLILGVRRMTVPGQIEAEQLPERIATILYQPEKYTTLPKEKPQPIQETKPEVEKIKPLPPPKKVEKPVKIEVKPSQKKPELTVPKEMNVSEAKKPATAKAAASSGKAVSKAQKMAKEGEGARAKGKEGTRGKTNAPKIAEPQTKAARTSPQGGAGTGGGQSQVADQGNVDLLKGAGSKIQDLFGNSQLGGGKGGNKLEGFGGFDTQGKGGLALSGNGPGGGGDAAFLGGLGKQGRGGGRVGTGLGAAGQGSGIVGGRTRMAIRSGGPEEAVVMGSIDASAVEAALLAHRDEFRLCYEREINAENSNLAGRVSTTFVIGSSGRVNQAGIESSTLKNANAERCILEVIRRIDFPIPKGAGLVQVTYPFKFQSNKN
jgi:outer membrane biosynthesis protein TonB/pSer/pThr/pTyr-binding forkhead associated (FHA) protein